MRRLLTAAPAPERRSRRDRPIPRACFWLATAAVLVRMGVSTNLLALGGIDYAAPGGNPVIKIHPGTYLASLAFAATLLCSGAPLRRLWRHCLAYPSHPVFVGAMLLCIAHTVANVGLGGAAVFVDSYLCAGLVAAMLVQATARQRRTLAWLLVSLMTLNAAIGVGETLTQGHVIPLAVNGVSIMDKPDDFRGYALYDHPLTAAMITQMGLFLVLAMELGRLRTAMLIGLFLVGLIGFGGRTALLVVALTLAGLGGGWLVREAVARRLDSRMAAAAAALAVLVPLALWAVMTATPIGVRLAGKLYFDESAAARNVQWSVVGLMDFKYVLLGTPIDVVEQICHQLGLDVPFSDIENFWLATFVMLGLVGFLYFLIGFLPFVWHLWRMASFHGRVMLATLLLVASTSNSLARKSNVLVILTATVIASTGFKQPLARDERPALPRNPAGAGWRALAVGRPAAAGLNRG